MSSLFVNVVVDFVEKDAVKFLIADEAMIAARLGSYDIGSTQAS